MSQSDFENMMVWALGEEWKYQNVKEAPVIFHQFHPEFLTLESMKGKPMMHNVAFYIFQMHEAWIKTHCQIMPKKCCKAQKCEVKKNEDGICNVLKLLWDEAKEVFRFKKKPKVGAKK